MDIIYYLTVFVRKCKENARINSKLITDVFQHGDYRSRIKLFNCGVNARVSLDIA